MTSLDAELIRRSIESHTATRLDRFEVFAEIDSTSTWLMNQPQPPPGHVSVVLAEHQTNGRGRRHRQWISAPGCSLCLSVGYTFRRAPANLPALTLALGANVVKELTGLGAQNLRLKWPNDLLIGDAKLGGILTETQFRDCDDISVVAGIGINIDLPDSVASRVEPGWAYGVTELRSAMAAPPSREQLGAAMSRAMFDAFVNYDEHGFDYFEEDFVAVDWLLGKHVVVETASGDIAGIAAGIDSLGALRVENDDGTQKIISGSIRYALRKPPLSGAAPV